MNTNSGQCRLSVPILQRGDRSQAVRTLQLLLIGNGYDCGYAADDGIFGKRTAEALRRFQEDRYLPATAVADSESWHSLLLHTAYGEVMECNL